MKSWIPLLLATGFVAGTFQMASAVDNVTVKLGSQTSSSQFFVKDSNDAAVLTVNADNTTAINGTLSVSGAATMSSTLSVTGAATVGGASTLGGNVQITGIITDNDSDVYVNDGLIVTGSISDNASDLVLNDNVIVTGTIIDNSSGDGRVTVSGLAGSRIADIRDNSTDFVLGTDNSTVLMAKDAHVVLPASMAPGIMFTIMVASDNASSINLKTAATSISVTTAYTDNGTIVVATDNSTVLDNSSLTTCIARTATAYSCISNGD